MTTNVKNPEAPYMTEEEKAEVRKNFHNLDKMTQTVFIDLELAMDAEEKAHAGMDRFAETHRSARETQAYCDGRDRWEAYCEEKEIVRRTLEQLVESMDLMEDFLDYYEMSKEEEEAR